MRTHPLSTVNRWKPIVAVINSWSKIPLFLMIILGLALPGCGKKESAAGPPKNYTIGPDGKPRAIPREYVVNGQIDLAALTQTLRDYVMLKGSLPRDLNELVTSGYLPGLPKPPPGKRLNITRYGMGYAVTLDP